MKRHFLFFFCNFLSKNVVSGLIWFIFEAYQETLSKASPTSPADRPTGCDDAGREIKPWFLHPAPSTHRFLGPLSSTLQAACFFKNLVRIPTFVKMSSRSAHPPGVDSQGGNASVCSTPRGVSHPGAGTKAPSVRLTGEVAKCTRRFSLRERSCP